MSKFAENTKTSVESSRAEIERTISKYGARRFAIATEPERGAIMFEIQGRQIRFIVPMPNPKAEEFVKVRKGAWANAAVGVQRARYDQAVRQRWRALALAIKAKLEVVESGISTLETEFLGHIVMSDGRTVGQWATPQLEAMYTSGKMPPLLGYTP